MKILFISDLYPLKEDDSIPKVIEDFAVAFLDYGNSVSVIRPNFLLNTIIRKHKIIKNGIYERKGIKIYNKNFILPFLFDDFSDIEKDFDFDLIISHMPSGHIYADLINKKLKLPHISIIHNSDYRVLDEFKYLPFKNRLKKALNKASIKGARNKSLKEALSTDFILPSFIDKDFIVQKKEIIDNKKLKIITLSKLIKRKNLNLVIEALNRANLEKKFDFEYSVYGNGKEEKQLKKLINKYNLQDKIKIYPFINHDLIKEKLDENDIFILPSINETFGLSYLEAMARGLITIGTKNTGIDGVIQNNENGFLINPKKEDILEVLNIINNSNKEKIIQNTLQNVQNYTKEKIMNKYFEIIKKIL